MYTCYDEDLGFRIFRKHLFDLLNTEQQYKIVWTDNIGMNVVLKRSNPSTIISWFEFRSRDLEIP